MLDQALHWVLGIKRSAKQRSPEPHRAGEGSVKHLLCTTLIEFPMHQVPYRYDLTVLYMESQMKPNTIMQSIIKSPFHRGLN